MALNSHTSGGYWHSILTPRGLLGQGLETRGLLGCYWISTCPGLWTGANRDLNQTTLQLTMWPHITHHVAVKPLFSLNASSVTRENSPLSPLIYFR